MSTNLRLSEQAAAALRQASARTGRSQQELLREAVHRYFGLKEDEAARDRAVASGIVRSPTPFWDVAPSVTLARGLTTLDLLDREDDR